MTQPLQIDPRLKDYDLTKKQLEILEAIETHGSATAAAKALGLNKSGVTRTVRDVQKKVARQGYAPGHFTAGVAPGYLMGKVTVQRANGAVERTWERMSPDQAQLQENVKAFVDGLMDEARGLPPVVPPPRAVLSDLLAVYAFGDPHFGQRACAEEAGEDFDLAEADRITRAGIDRLASAAPDSETAILLVVGDNTHANDSSHKTPAHGNALDMDAGGHNRSMFISAKAWSYAARRLLEKHRRVVVWIMPGNHDPDAAYALALCLALYFEKEPRIEVDLSTSLYRYLRFGKVLIGSHHGHGAKIGDLPLIMAVDRAEDWGVTTSKFIYVGHIHHDTVKEIQGVRVESLRTLAAKDAWHAGKGYRSMRDTRVIVHHKDFGEIERHTVSAAMLSGSAA